MGAKNAEVTVTHRGAAAVCFVGVFFFKKKFNHFHKPETNFGRIWWPCGLRRGSAAARLLGLRVRIPPVEWMSLCCECCVCGQVEVCAMG
jgi:hypothetical protein